MSITNLLPNNYKNYPLWLTLDLEELEDANFNLIKIKNYNIDYYKIIDRWLLLCENYNIKSTIFVLGTFVEKYPDIVKKIYQSGHEIASHGYKHNLIYNESFSQWSDSINHSKKLLEDTISDEVVGYRSPSWSLPYDNRYYDELLKAGYKYSSSYFPFKTYMYGNSTDKKEPFLIHKNSIVEIPIPKLTLPFSGGFYLRVLPTNLLKYMFNSMIKQGTKPVIYIHPYELLDENLMSYLFSKMRFNKDYILATFTTSKPNNKIQNILSEVLK